MLNNITALFLISGATLWGLNFHLAKFMLSSASFIEAGFWRYLFGVGFLIVVQAIFRSKLPSKKDLLEGWKRYFLAGFIGLFGFNIFFFLGLKYTTALNAALQVSLNPILTLFFAYWMLGTAIHRHQVVGTIIAIFGVFILLTKGSPWSLVEVDWSIGDLLIFGANVLFAIHHIWVKKYNNSSLSNVSFTMITNGLCLAGFLILLSFTDLTPVYQLDSIFWLSALGIGVLGTGLAYILWNEGVKRTGAAQAGFIMNVVPFATAVFAVIFGEQVESYHLVSGGLIFIGMLYFQGYMDRLASTISTR